MFRALRTDSRPEVTAYAATQAHADRAHAHGPISDRCGCLLTCSASCTLHVVAESTGILACFAAQAPEKDTCPAQAR